MAHQRSLSFSFPFLLPISYSVGSWQRLLESVDLFSKLVIRTAVPFQSRNLFTKHLCLVFELYGTIFSGDLPVHLHLIIYLLATIVLTPTTEESLSRSMTQRCRHFAYEITCFADAYQVTISRQRMTFPQLAASDRIEYI